MQPYLKKFLCSIEAQDKTEEADHDTDTANQVIIEGLYILLHGQKRFLLGIKTLLYAAGIHFIDCTVIRVPGLAGFVFLSIQRKTPLIYARSQAGLFDTPTNEKKMDAGDGFEPSFPASEADVLPLDHPATLH